MANLSVTDLERGSVIRVDGNTGTIMWVVRRLFLREAVVARVDTVQGEVTTFFVGAVYMDDADIAVLEERGHTVWLLPGKVIELPKYL